MILLSVTPIYKQFEVAYKPLLITLGNAQPLIKSRNETNPKRVVEQK